MTREEAINTLANFKMYISGGGVTSRTDTEALNMAIQALENNYDEEWREEHYKNSYNQGYVDACKYFEALEGGRR